MPTAAQYKQLIITELSTADSEAQADLQSRVPALWDLFTLKAAWPDVRYWYTKREAIKLLMGRTRRQIDTTRRNSLAVGNSNNDVIADARTETHAITETSEVGVASTIRHHENQSDGSTVGTSNVEHHSVRTDSETVDYYDIGSGTGRTDTYAHKYHLITNSHYTVDEHDAKGTLTLYDKSTLNDWGHFVAQPTYSPTGTQLEKHRDTYSVTDAAIILGVKDDVHTIYRSGDLATRDDVVGYGERSRVGNLTTVNYTTGYADTQLDATRGFQANTRDAHHRDVSGFIYSLAPNRVDDTTNEIAHSAGNMTHDGRHESRGLTLSRTDSHDTTVGASQSLETSQATTLMQKAQQQFKHLKELFEDASAHIKVLEQQAVISGRYPLGEMAARDSNLVALCPLPMYSL